MIPHLKESRITKALADRITGGVAFDVAENRLAAVRLAVVMRETRVNAAAQAAALTVIAIACKCFGTATLVLTDPHEKLAKPLPIGSTLGQAATAFGATLASGIPHGSTHVIAIGNGDCADAFVRCWGRLEGGGAAGIR
jgi:hypothetical protein